tara:strand:- start:1518 stop:2291 length:774 start_codon:yes stop_codon:yes gene_type:complete
MKINRNDKCPCNSNKKYKKCCYKTGLFERDPEKILHRFELDKTFNRPSNPIWRKSLINLPVDVLSKIIPVINENNVIRGMCYRNSHLLSFEIDEVDVVHGWYGWGFQKDSVVDNHYWNVVKTGIDSESVEHKGDDVYLVYRTNEFNYTEGVFIDMKYRILYRRHCWNKYKDIHFCVTSEFLQHDEVWKKEQKGDEGIGYKNQWINFIETKTYDTSSLSSVPSIKQKYYEVLDDWTEDFITNNKKQHYGLIPNVKIMD